MPSHWGSVEHHVVTQSSPTGSSVPARGRLRRGRPLHLAAARIFPAASRTATSSPTCRSARARRSEGEFWESLNTACTLHLPVLFLVADNGFAISVPSSDQSPAPISELVRGFRGLEIHQLDGTDYFEVRGASRVDHQPCARRRRPGADPRHGDAALFALGRRHAGEVPPVRRTRRRARARPDHTHADRR